jgi:hypothetical protein|tara:strand:+ start:1071 stop:1766 length:696 start_codon:yes stop_codon:yes gene_type:complete
MQLHNDTIDILKNFALINPSIAFTPGNDLQTIAPSKIILAKAKIKDSWPTSGAIYDLSRFLGVISLFEKPEFDFTETQVIIKGSTQTVNYTFADSSMILTPPTDKDLYIDKPDIDLDIPGSKITAVLKAAAVLQLPEVALMCDGSMVYLQVLDSQNPSSDDYKQELQTWNNQSTFRIIFGTENFKMMPYDYNLKIESHKDGGRIAQFTCLSDKRPGLVYWVATKLNSTFGE